MLRKLSFILALIGIAFLLVSLWMPAQEYDEIEGLEENSKIIISGYVESFRDYGGFSIMEIEGVEIVCDGCGKEYNGKVVEIEGVVEEYNGEKQVRVLRLVKLLE